LTYRLHLDPGDRVDAYEFASHARTALSERDRSRKLTLLQAGAAAWTGAPLPEDRNSHWSAGWRETLENLHVEVLAQTCDEHLRAGDDLGAIEAALLLVEADPDNEAAHRRLMVAYARSGRRGSALRQYLACRRVLVAEFGVEPAAETKDLHERILAGTAV
jgi:DNA-binding SARP family transcriptional activator